MLDWKLFAVGSAFFAGLTAVLAKVGVKNIPSNLAKSLIFLVLSGITTGLSWLCYYRALKTGPASLVAPIDKLSLGFAIILAVLFLGERLNVFQWIGASLIFAGTLILVFK
jgi:bacterial/archaeal transporter family protein